MTSDRKKKILLIDDEKDILLVLADFLRDEGYDVAMAHNGLQALDMFVTYHPDLVLSDNMMPFMSGLDVLQKFRSLPGFLTTPFIIMSAAPLGQNDNRHPPSDFLRKPFDADVILKLVEKYTKVA